MPFLALVCFSACQSESPIKGNAVLEGAGADCGWIIQFNEKQKELPYSEDDRYILVNLDGNHQIEGIEIYVETRAAVGNEILVCSTKGEVYPQIFITKLI